MNLELTGMMPVKFCCLVWIVIPNLMTLQCSPQQHSDLQKCNISHAANETTVDCSRCGFSRVPRGFPRNTTELNLGNNNLSSLRNGSLPYLPSLHTLLVNDNNIEFLEEGALQNLPALQRLNLDGNKFNFTYSSLPLGTFQNLTSLTTLRVGRMKMQFSSLTYPDATFADLHYLESLVIDGAGEPVFGPGFAQMKRLKSLTFGSPVLIRRLGNSSFVNFREAPISNLTLSLCRNLIFLDDNVFSPFFELRFLLARDTTPFGLYPSLLSLKGLSGRNMTEIDFSHVHRYDVTVKDVLNNQTLMLTSEMTRYLVTICVERLILRDNNIIVIESSALLQEPFQSCLRYIDLRRNAVNGEPKWLFLLPEFYNLVVLDVSKQLNQLYLGDGQDTNSKDLLGKSWGNMTFYLPPLLEKLLLSGSGAHDRVFKATNIFFHGGEHLTYLDLSYSALIMISWRIYGVEHVKYLDFTGNFFQNIPLTFFQSFPNVMILYLNNVHFDTDLMSNMRSQTLFSPLRNVRSLDISFNSLYKMYTHIFGDLKTLKYLNLSRNVFEDVPIELSGMLNITHIDLSFNSIGVLSTNTRTMLDERVFDSQQFSLDLHGNILSCGCGALDFLTWIIDTDVQFRRFDSYSCLNTEGQLIKLSNITSSFGRHWRYCYARFWLAFSVCLMCVLISSLVICHVILKNSISLKYWMLRLIGFDYCVQRRQDYLYDIFIYYSQHDDYEWVCTTFLQKMEVERGLRLCIPDRDFEVGVCAAEEIINCIHNSWKTVLYVTETFLQDELCSFTLSSGIYACNNNMPKRLTLLYSDAILRHPLPPLLTQLLDGDGVFVLEDLEENNAWQRLFEHVLRWI
ncbi:toll-like receptor 3 [Haliotis rufescens]|uniref:toll-like receptor 3 n=1 Tax=Haliotis rufescens TaxID=6454 RepID=UPI00201E7C4F|nr:toll-like receptor 3 [Haliotis rufescens]